MWEITQQNESELAPHAVSKTYAKSIFYLILSCIARLLEIPRKIICKGLEEKVKQHFYIQRTS